MTITTDTGPITIAHDYFTQRGGAERVAAALIEVLAPERVVTALHAPANTFNVSAAHGIETTFLQRVESFRQDPRRALPALPVAWRMMPAVREGVVICSSSGWSHAIRTKDAAYKIVYCHNPARWLYQPKDFFKDQPAAIRFLAKLIRPLLLRWDRAAANTADMYIANSTAVAERIHRIYGRDPVILHPPISIDPDGDRHALTAVAPGYFVTVGRGRGYKNVDLLLRAFRQLPNERLLVVGAPPAGADIPENVEFRPNLSDAQLRWTYEQAVALISVSHEDFGLTPLEANAMGTPSLVLRAGGFLDSLAEGVSGEFINDSEPSTIEAAVRAFPRQWNKTLIQQHAAKFSTRAFAQNMQDFILSVAEPGPVTVSDKHVRSRPQRTGPDANKKFGGE